ncbi:MAG: hypothetical protein J6W00_13030 [Lentisphaeria bacterium]|nr:hypothetical protein [Lentisphaeria bacterium]
MRVSIIILVLASVILFTGCAVPTLANGKYETSLPGREDFVAVYNGLLIMRLRNPEKASGTDDGYWDWGGKFTVREDNQIDLDMDRQTARKWMFYYQLSRNGKGIKVHDLRAENSYQLDYMPPRRQTQSNAAAEGDKEVPSSAYPAFN